MSEKKLQSVLVTGAMGSLGSAVVQKFLAAGMDVIGTCHRGKPPSDHPRMKWIEVDLADPAEVKSQLGALSVDALIHCAGGFRFAMSDQISDADLDFLLDANLKSAFYLVRELLPGMKKRDFGRIIFVSSKSTLQSPAGMSAYSASKAALNMLTSSLVEEVRQFDINVNAVLPSIIDTPANRAEMPKADPVKWVSTGALAEIIFSLTQPWGKPIHGALIPVGGRV